MSTSLHVCSTRHDKPSRLRLILLKRNFPNNLLSFTSHSKLNRTQIVKNRCPHVFRAFHWRDTKRIVFPNATTIKNFLTYTHPQIIIQKFEPTVCLITGWCVQKRSLCECGLLGCDVLPFWKNILSPPISLKQKQPPKNTTQHHMTENHNGQDHCRENIKSLIL